MRQFGFPKCFNVMIAVMVCFFVVQEKIDAAKCPCDIYADGGTPCVAAHGTVRALYSSYNGPLYQVRRASDGKTINIGLLTPGGIAGAGTFFEGAMTFGFPSDAIDGSVQANIVTAGYGRPRRWSVVPLETR